MVLDEFKEKFEKLIKILTTNEKIAQDFSSIDTVDESFDFACNLVGEMDRDRYHDAVKDYIENLDSDQESIFDSSFESQSSNNVTNASYSSCNSSDDSNDDSLNFKRSSSPDSTCHRGYKKISSSDEKKISGGVLFRHRKMHI